MVMQNTKSLTGKIFWLIRHRPIHTFSTARGYFLFLFSYFSRIFFLRNPNHIQLGRNVRLQKLSSLMAEKPDASISIGSHSIVYENAKIGAYGNGIIEVGDHCILGDVRILSRKHITIGNRVITSWNVFIQDFDPHPIDPSQRARQVTSMCIHFRPAFNMTNNELEMPKFDWKPSSDDIFIGDDVWIGSNCTILKGAKIGSGSIIASGAVVLSGNYPDSCILAGNPAKTVKNICHNSEHALT